MAQITLIWHLIHSVCICLLFSYLLFLWRFPSALKFIDNMNKVDFSSSIWCRGDSTETRLCHLKNICYNANVKEFLFFHGPQTIISGIKKYQTLRNKSNKNYEPISQLTSVMDMNTFWFDVTELPHRAIRNYNLELFKEKTFIYKRFKPDNLMHIFHDDLLPIYATLQEIQQFSENSKEMNVRLAFIDDYDYETTRRFSTLYELLTKKKIIYSNEFNSNITYCFEDAYVGVNRDTVWYDYGFSRHQKSLIDEKLISKTTINNFKNYFTSKLNINVKTLCDSDKKYAVLALRRSTRLILNPSEVAQLISKISGKRVEILIEDDIFGETFDEVIKQMSCASMLVGMHSAALVLSLFLSPTSILLEMFPYAVNPDNYQPYKSLAEINDLRYMNWVNELEAYTVTHPENEPEFGGLNHLDEQQQLKILTSTTVGLHRCCDDPQWLFRIFQDTRVDKLSFSASVTKALSLITRPAFEDRMKELDPGPIRKVTCVDQKNVFNVSWSAPWNLQYLRENPKYELWIQERESTEIKSIVTVNNYYLINKSLLIVEWDCWVRIYQKNSKMIWCRCKQT